MRHETRFRDRPRTAMQWRSLDRLDPAQRDGIRIAADALRGRLANGAGTV